MANEQMTNAPLTEAEIEAGLALCAAATPEMWEHWPENIGNVFDSCVGLVGCSVHVGIRHGDDGEVQAQADAAFIAAARTLLPRALAQLQARAAEIEWLKIKNEAIEADLTNTRFVNSNTEERLTAAELRGARAALEAAELEFSPGDYIQTGEHPAATIRALVDDDEWLAALLEDK